MGEKLTVLQYKSLSDVYEQRQALIRTKQIQKDIPKTEKVISAIQKSILETTRDVCTTENAASA